MSLRTKFALLGLAALCCCPAGPLQADPVTISVDTNKPGVALRPEFYGLMTEEINHAFDGGLYAELIQNRNFKGDPNTPVHWSLVQDAGGSGRIALSADNPVTPALSESLNITITQAGPKQRVGVANDGYWGVPVRPDTTYAASFFAQAANGFTGPVTVSLESADGSKVYASAGVPSITSDWKQYKLTLKTGRLTASSDNRFVISGAHPGTLRLSLVSLFPPTYNNRPNGNRIDLMEKLAGLHPAFLRMPGGNYLDPGHYIWKNTIGPLDQRPGSNGAWGYKIDEGLGLLEMLEWCQDLHMGTVLAVSDGRGWLAPDGDVTPLVQDALDEIEYATGDVKTPWGARRAKDGHPAPFPVHYVEIGNEDFFGTPAIYNARFAKFYDAIKAKYPKLQIIATRKDVTSRVPDVIDEHYYRSARASEADAFRYDSYSRTGPKIFVGEWASTEGKPTPTMNAALGDAAWLTGMERNADVVSMESYAPLLVNVNPGASQWGTNLIGYDALNSFGSPSYYVQSMFAGNHGDVELKTKVRALIPDAAPSKPSGGVGVGTWNTQAEFTDASVTINGATIAPTDGGNPFGNWALDKGDWKSDNNALTQTGAATYASYLDIQPDWTNYTFHVKARKTGGAEGFLIFFHVRDKSDFLWWNVGGWHNTGAQVERTDGGIDQPIGERVPMTVETGRLYDIRVEVNGNDIKCYLDGKFVQETIDQPQHPLEPVYASASRDLATGDIFLHLVNTSDADQPVQVNLNGAKSIAATATGEIISGDPADQNSIQEPEKIVPQKLTVTDAAPSYTQDLPAHSVSVLRLNVK